MSTSSPSREIPVPGGVTKKKRRPRAKRLASLDAFRGFIMLMLAADGFGIADLAALSPDNAVWTRLDYDTWNRIGFHFRHPPWESVFGWGGVAFWDLIQPAFMFMVGVAMPLSFAHRQKSGDSVFQQHRHAITRAVILVLMGVFLYSLKRDQTNWIFTNVLAQIGLGYYFAYLLLGRSAKVQLAALLVILVGTWTLFKIYEPPDNYDFARVNASVEAKEVYTGAYRPWSKNGNAAHFFDVWLLNTLRSQPTTSLEQDANADDDAAESDESTEPTPADAPANAAAPDPAAIDPATANADATDVEDAASATETSTDPTDEEPAAAPPASAAQRLLAAIRAWWFTDPEPFEFNGGGYATLSFLPSIATTLLGIFCGQLLLKPVSHRDRILPMLLWAVLCFGFGLLAHFTVCPIVKRIWTPSWVLFSGGYCITMLIMFYILIDALPLRKLAFPLIVVGMNSIVMYFMGQMLREWVTVKVVKTHFGRTLNGLFGLDLGDNNIGVVVFPTATFVVFWLVAFWMYRRRYFVRV